MYKIWHKLFGWDYVLFRWGGTSEIKRIIITPNGTEYIKIYSKLELITSVYLQGLVHLTREIPE